METVYLILVFVFGLIFGSFYNVVGLRLSKGESIVKPKSHCTSCNHELKVLDFDCRNFAQQNHISEETAGRVLRYEAFEQYARSLEESTGKTVRIAIAHHKDDIAETMMMNLFIR